MAGLSEAAQGGTPAPGALLSAADVSRVVDRMAHQLIERAAAANPGSLDGGVSQLVLVGIPTRGAPLARRPLVVVAAPSPHPAPAPTSGCGACGRWSRRCCPMPVSTTASSSSSTTC